MATSKMTGAAVRRLRKRLGLSQAAFAERVHLHPNSLARIERNEIGMRASTVELIRRVAEELESAPAVKPGGRAIRMRE